MFRKKLIVLLILFVLLSACNTQEEIVLETNTGVETEAKVQELKAELAETERLLEQEAQENAQREAEEALEQSEIDDLQFELQQKNTGWKFVMNGKTITSTKVLSKNGIDIRLEKWEDNASKLFIVKNGNQTMIESIPAPTWNFEIRDFQNYEFLDGTTLLKYEIAWFETVEMKFFNTQTRNSIATNFLTDYGITKDKTKFCLTWNSRLQILLSCADFPLKKAFNEFHSRCSKSPI